MALSFPEMVSNNLYATSFILALVLNYTLTRFFKSHQTKSGNHLPPSPPSLPFVGHLYLLGQVLPVSLQALARRYGPLMKISLGASRCVVASNSAMAKDIFKTQELNFSSRPEFGSAENFMYRGSRFILAEYGDYWRFMKKLCMTRLLAVPQLQKFCDVREEERIKLVESVARCCREGKPCDLTTELTTYTNNTICRMAMSTKCSGSDSEAEAVKRLVKESLELAGKLSVGDVLGPLKVFDFSGNAKKLVNVMHRYDKLVERIISEHEEKKRFGGDKQKDILDILLETYEDPQAEVKLTKKDIKSFLLDIFMAGTDTSSSAMQWAMGELINHPESLSKLRQEIDAVVGPTRLVTESDVQNLPYLRAVIRETLRLHPSAPLIIRECAEDSQVGSWVIKARTRVLVNVYAIMRDPEQWRNPDEFMPERFLESSGEKIGEHQMEFKGQNFRFLPFGSGRRGCAGASLAMEMMHAALGSLVQRFDWKVEGGGKADLRQGSGFAAEMAKPLVCRPVERS